MTSSPAWVHVTQTLCTDESPINTVVKALSHEAKKRGISSAVVGAYNRSYHFADARLIEVDFTKYLKREYLLRREVLADTITGHARLGRPYVKRLVCPVAEIFDSERSDGPVIVHEGFYGAYGLDLIRVRAVISRAM